jgi:signal transduction histidine kinase
MGGTTNLAVILVFIGVIVMTICAFAGFLLVLNNTRRIRHRAELAELHLQREKEVITAEREATRQTLREVGRELHDNVGQLLTVAQLGLNTALEEHADARLNASRDALDQGIEEVRRLGHSLDSELGPQRSFADAISHEAERIERVGRVNVHVQVKGMPPDLAPETRTILFRVFQEVMNNAMKHSRADTISVTMDAGPPPLLSISDNGRGFDLEATAGNGGLRNIRHRCMLIGYDASCVSAPGAGCTWTIEQRTVHGTQDSVGG